MCAHRRAFMVQFLVAVVVLLACAPCTIAIAVAVLKLSGDNWADWSAAPVSWGLTPAGAALPIGARMLRRGRRTRLMCSRPA